MELWSSVIYIFLARKFIILVHYFDYWYMEFQNFCSLSKIHDDRSSQRSAVFPLILLRCPPPNFTLACEFSSFGWYVPAPGDLATHVSDGIAHCEGRLTPYEPSHEKRHETMDYYVTIFVKPTIKYIEIQHIVCGTLLSLIFCENSLTHCWNLFGKPTKGINNAWRRKKKRTRGKVTPNCGASR